jgi:drug/metabolite transporter (DMT)-like permease
MRDTPHAPFVAVGLLEGITNVAQTYLAIHLPGALLPLLSQSGVIWQLGLSAVLLGRRYSVRQVASALIVVAGVVLAGIPARGTSHNHLCSFYLLLRCLSFVRHSSIAHSSTDSHPCYLLPSPLFAGVPAGAAHPYDVLAYVGTFSFIALDVLLKVRFAEARVLMAVGRRFGS